MTMTQALPSRGGSRRVVESSGASRDGQDEKWVWWAGDGAWSRKASQKRWCFSRVLRGTRMWCEQGVEGRRWQWWRMGGEGRGRS